MQKQTLCFLVVGASLAVLLQNLAKRRDAQRLHRPPPRGPGAEIIDLAHWREARRRETAAVSLKGSPA